MNELINQLSLYNLLLMLEVCFLLKRLFPSDLLDALFWFELSVARRPGAKKNLIFIFFLFLLTQ